MTFWSVSLCRFHWEVAKVYLPGSVRHHRSNGRPVLSQRYICAAPVGDVPEMVYADPVAVAVKTGTVTGLPLTVTL